MATTEPNITTTEPREAATTQLTIPQPTNETTPGDNNTTHSQFYSTIAPTTDSTTVSSTPYAGTKKEAGSSGKMEPIVGGVVGGVAVIVVLVIVVLLFVRYRRKQITKKPREAKMAPGIQDLQKFEGGAAAGVPIYTNIDGDGRPNDTTDPSIGDDGYLQKSKQKKKRKAKQGRQNSMPLHPAPPTPLSTLGVTTDTNTMGAYENIHKSTKNTVHSKPSKAHSSSVPKSSVKPPLSSGHEPGYVNSREPSLKAGAGASTDKEYVNMEANGGHQPQTYANIGARALQPDTSPDGSEQLYENPSP